MDTPVILFVDDEKDVLSALQRVFFDEPYRIVTALSGEEALRLLEQSPADIIIADYRMPTMNGAEFLTRAQQLAPASIKIMLSGFAEAETVLELIEKGVIYTFVGKPWNDDELRLIVRRGIEFQATQREVERLTAELEQANKELDQLRSRNHRSE